LGGDASLDGVSSNVDHPLAAHILLDGGIIAQSNQQHLGESSASQLALGEEVTLAVASQDAQVHAVADVGSRPAVSGHVVEHGGVGGQLFSRLGAQQQVADNLSSLLTGQDGVGLEVALIAALEYTETDHNVDSLNILDLTGISEILARSAGAHDHHAHEH